VIVTAVSWSGPRAREASGVVRIERPERDYGPGTKVW
jgi:hypothetical protein